MQSAHPQPAAIHVDLDGAAEIYDIHGWRYPEPLDPLFESGLRGALDFFSENRVQATLFVIGRQLDDPRKRELLREAVRQGHEIASHTITHRPLPYLSPKEKRREIFDSRDLIGALLGTRVRGFRAPAFEIDRESLELLAEAGYDYDSSLFPTARCARLAGVPEVRPGPHAVFDGRALLELPMPTAAPLPFPFHPCYSLVLGMRYFRLALGRFAARSSPLVFLFHLTDFADPLPAHVLRSRRQRFYTLSGLTAERKRALCLQMLDAVRERFTVVPTRDLLPARSAKASST